MSKLDPISPFLSPVSCDLLVLQGLRCEWGAGVLNLVLSLSLSHTGHWKFNRSARSLTSTSSVMSSWGSGRGHQWQPVKLWWTPCPRGLRQCWKIMVATQNIDTLGPIWTFSLRGVLTFVASGLDINGCVLSYFEGTANVHCYTSCTLTTLHCSKVSFLQSLSHENI